jgi:hypothetical protein
MQSQLLPCGANIEKEQLPSENEEQMMHYLSDADILFRE